MCYYELYKYEKNVIWGTGWWNKFLKQDLYLENVEFTGYSVNIFIEVKTELEFLFYSLSSWINRLAGLECSSSWAGHD